MERLEEAVTSADSCKIETLVAPTKGKFYMSRFSPHMAGLALLAGIASVPAQAGYEFYGLLHVSTDFVDTGPEREIRVASNESRVGVKGSQDLDFGLKALWKVETGLDLTGQSSQLTPRNRYVGLLSSFGSVIAGYHDTPYKALGTRIDLFTNTVGDRRAILGNGNGTASDVRARNALMYISPRVAGIELRVLGTSGESGAKSSDQGVIRSVSAVHNSSLVYFGAAYEEQRQLDTEGIRAGGGLTVGDAQLNAIYERMTAGGDSPFDRDAYGLSIAYRFSATTFEVQALQSADVADRPNSRGGIYSAGVSQTLGKSVDIYAMASRVDNKSGSAFGAAPVGHGETYATSAPGQDVYAASLGMEFKF